MAEIRLEGIEFFAYHGHHDEERITGNKYSVDMYIETDLSQAAESDSLKDTVNYVVIYNIIKEEMAKPARLLEHISHRINQEVLKEYPEIKRVRTAVSKFNPPVGGICKKATVTTEGP
jgi:dihydroneopterin aldolase